ncbi:MAG: NAD-dependent epimerase/dehydratase family protein [Christensenellaceae bacterium]
MKIIVSGGTGMIASTLLSLALSKGYEATAIVRRGSARLSNLPVGVRTIECDLDEYARLETKEQGDVFFHLAWAKTSVAGRDDASTQERNIAYTLDAVALAKRMGCSCFVGAGSQAEYGRQDAPLSSATCARPESGYGIAKYAAGKLSFLACDQLGMRHCWTRILSVFGKGDAPTTLISYLARSFQAGVAPELTKCEQIWDYIDSRDAARALLLIGEKGVHGKTYPIGSGRGRPLSEYVKEMRDILSPTTEIRFGAKEYYPHQPMFLVADIGELAADTGFAPKYDFGQGIAYAYAKSALFQERKE